jgi:Nickel responsive protein SCO4226-like
MPRFLDIHSVAAGATPESLAVAHAKDLAVQHKYGVRYLRYYYDTATRRVFCLSDAPDQEAALAVRREAHGRMPDENFEGQEFE